MDIGQLLEHLNSESLRNNALHFLENIIVDTDTRITDAISHAIDEPSSIENTNRFASLLTVLPSDDYIPRLIARISSATPDQTPWLADYMYALGNILIDRDSFWPADENFVHLMGRWLLSTGGGEISWKSGDILAELDHASSRAYLLRGAADAELFHQTRIACIRGIVNYYRNDADLLLRDLQDDPEQKIREAVADARKWLEEGSREA